MPRYSSDFAPILLENHTATLFGSTLPAGGMNVKCIGVGALPEYYKDFGALTAATWDEDNEDTNLEMSPMELGQFRVRILDDMVCRLKNPAALLQWRTSKTTFTLPQFPTDPEETFLKNYYWKASEFFIFENTTPRFDFYSVYASATSRVLFSGWRFKLEEIAEKGVITIWVDSWPPGKK